MGRKSFILLSLGLFIIWLLCISILRTNLGSSIRFFNDDYDRSIYALRGEWLLNNQVPYRDTISEYPQVPTYLFAIPYLFYTHDMTRLIGYSIYSSEFSFFTLCLLLGTIFLLYKMLPTKKWFAFLMLLPAPLFFTYNRFDILPAFLCLLSIFLLKNQKWFLSMIILGIATMTKWYPLLLLPVFLSYMNSTQPRYVWRMLLTFCFSCFIITAPTLFTGGIKAFLVPYAFHAGRELETISFPASISRAIQYWSGGDFNKTVWIYFFVILQVLVSPFCLLDRIDRFEKALHWNIMIIASFLLFSRIYSPQWLLWLFPSLILTARNRLDINWIVFYGIVTYMGFPVAWDSGNLMALQLLGIVNIITIGYFMVKSFRRVEMHLSINNFPLFKNPKKIWR